MASHAFISVIILTDAHCTKILTTALLYKKHQKLQDNNIQYVTYVVVVHGTIPLCCSSGHPQDVHIPLIRRWLRSSRHQVYVLAPLAGYQYLASLAIRNKTQNLALNGLRLQLILQILVVVVP